VWGSVGEAVGCSVSIGVHPMAATVAAYHDDGQTSHCPCPWPL
jgi:hypothetical protein